MTRTAQVSLGEMKQLQVTVLQGIPSDLEAERLRDHIGRGKARLHEVLRLILQSDLSQTDTLLLSALLEGRDLATAHYEDEEVESKFGFPGNFTFASPGKKLAILSRYFPNLDSSYAIEMMDAYSHDVERSNGGEELLICPKPSSVAESYQEALKLVLEFLKETRGFRDLGVTTNSNMDDIRANQKTNGVLEGLGREMPGDYLMFSVQTGIRHRGRSVRRAQACYSSAEFSLGAFEIACYLLTSPRRLVSSDNLGIICAGSEVMNHGFGRYPGTGEFDQVLDLSIDERGDLNLGLVSQETALADFGLATGFVPDRIFLLSKS